MDSESHHLVHSLTAHLALYYSRIHSPSPNPTHRGSVLRWFSSLSPALRQAAVTVSDPAFILILLQMQSRLRRHGHSHFLLLPDIPSSSPSNPSLPSISFRCFHGLISRYAASNSSAQLLSTSLVFFSSGSSVSSGVTVADSLTVSESLVSDVDRFVSVMDGLSGGRFLCEDIDMLGLLVPWVELPWLKDLGYYSLEAFVANGLEVILRLAWISLQGGKKPKEKRLKERAAEIAGKATNAFWRMKGCFDWWVGLDSGTRRVIILAFFGKASRALVNEIINEDKAALNEEFCFLNIGRNIKLQPSELLSWKKAKQVISRSDVQFGLDILPISISKASNNFAILLNKLAVFHSISNLLLAWQSGEMESEKLFFSSLESNFTISDYLTMKLQNFLMVFHSNLTNHELMEDAKPSNMCEKIEGKDGLASGKGKNKSRSSKKSNAIPKACIVTSKSPESFKKLNCQKSASSSVTRIAIINASEVKSLVVEEEKDNLNARISVDNKESNNKRKSRRKGSKNRSSNAKNPRKLKHENDKDTDLSATVEREPTKIESLCTLNSPPEFIDASSYENIVAPSFSDISLECLVVDSMQSRKDFEEGGCLSLAKHRSTSVEESHSFSGKRGSDISKHVSPYLSNSTYPEKQIDVCVGITGDSFIHNSVAATDRKHKHEISSAPRGTELKSNVSTECFHTAADEQSSVMYNGGNDIDTNSMRVTSYEWPNITPLHFPSINSHFPATDRLHLDVASKLPYRSLMPSKSHFGNSFNEFRHGHILPSVAFPMSYDWPPMVKQCSRLSQPQTIGYESVYSQSLPPSLYSGLASRVAHGVQVNRTFGDNEIKHFGDIINVCDTKNISDFVEEEGHWLSEDEFEPHARSGRDYNKFFGGGVMYWNPAELVGAGYSRPPSYSSEDSSWAWHEADLNRTIDDMVGCRSGFPVYNTNGLASPPSSTYCSPFDSMACGHPSKGYPVAGNDGSNTAGRSPSVSDISDEMISSSTANLNVGIKGGEGDPLAHPMLRPIVIPGMSRKGSRSDFKLGHDNKSACLPSSRRDNLRIKRPPSPVVLCVPRVPQPPPPSSVCDSRKRGFPIVRSGSSSPRHWGVKSWCQEESTVVDNRFCLNGAEVVWPAWMNKGLGVTAVAQSLPGSLIQDHLIAFSQLAHDQEHPDVALPLQPPDLLNGPCENLLLTMQNLLHEEIDFFCKQVAAENLIRKPFINWAIKRVTRSLQVLWPRSRTNIFGSNATGLSLPTSDVDLVVSLPPVRNLEPIKEAGILEGRNGIKETCLQHAARYLANQEWVRNDSLKTIENTAIPVIMLVAEVPSDINLSHGSTSIVAISKEKSFKIYGEHNCDSHLNLSGHENLFSSKNSSSTEVNADAGVKSIRLDISFKSTSHTGLQTSELVRELTQQFPASVPLALVLKKFLADRSLDRSYSGGLSSYCLVLLITRFLQHEHHCGYHMKQNLGSLLMDFLYFFGNVFDPRQMRVSIQGSGFYMKRERGLSIDPIHIDDPLFPTNNVGRNCFRIHQCIKAFADAYTTLENELSLISEEYTPNSAPSFRLLRKIVPSIGYDE